MDASRGAEIMDLAENLLGDGLYVIGVQFLLGVECAKENLFAGAELTVEDGPPATVA
jgi:hypothetical protein